MAPFIDARIPLIFGQASDAGPADAVLSEGDGEPSRGRAWFQPDAASVHPADCACCTPRSNAGMALARLILARGRGTGLFFNRVVVEARTPDGRQAVIDALESDPIASCTYRLEAGGAVPAPPDPPPSV